MFPLLAIAAFSDISTRHRCAIGATSDLTTQDEAQRGEVNKYASSPMLLDEVIRNALCSMQCSLAMMDGIEMRQGSEETGLKRRIEKKKRSPNAKQTLVQLSRTKVQNCSRRDTTLSTQNHIVEP